MTTHAKALAAVEWTAGVRPVEVEAGHALTIEARARPAAGGGIDGAVVTVADASGGPAETLAMAAADGAEWVATAVLDAPDRPGRHVWTATLTAPGQAAPPEIEIEFTVLPHETNIVVWDIPDTVAAGRPFAIKVGVRCARGCPPAGRTVLILDGDGRTLRETVPERELFAGTEALYPATVTLTAPDDVGLHEWTARVPARDDGVAHAGAGASFRVNVVPEPEVVIRVAVTDEETGEPVAGASVVSGPYRAKADRNGRAELSVPKGRYTLFVSGRGTIPYRDIIDVDDDIVVKASLSLDKALTEADIWS